jgi:hypothetical protein
MHIYAYFLFQMRSTRAPMTGQNEKVVSYFVTKTVLHTQSKGLVMGGLNTEITYFRFYM